VDGFSDDLDRIAYAMRTAGGRLLLGGGGNPAYSYHFGGRVVTTERAIARSQPFMTRILQRYFPAIAHIPIEHRWSGVLALTLDRQPSIGAGLVAPNVLHALGYSGHGVALALLAGKVLADLYVGNHDEWKDLAFTNKRLLHLPPEPLRWLGYQAYTRVTGRSPRQQT
jgi:glycine/D-amino acid oxidase-like deaminating enzyme